MFSLPPSRNSDPGSHSRRFSPLPTAVRALPFYRDNISALSSLVDSRLIVLTHARRFQQLILFYFANEFKISLRRDSNSRANTRIIRGLPLVHRGNRCYKLKLYVVHIISYVRYHITSYVHYQWVLICIVICIYK